jgi:hypothetical protein
LKEGDSVNITVAFISLAVMLALGVGAIGCATEYVPEIGEYSLVVSTSEGGDVTTPGGGTFTYYAGEVVSLVAVADDGYCFANWAGDVSAVADTNAAATTITMNDNYFVTANFHEIPVAYDFEEGEMTFPNPNKPNVGTAIRGDIAERGYLFPSDLQRHTFFTGIT